VGTDRPSLPPLDGWTLPDRGVLFVVSGPSGVGKSTLVRRALARIPGIGFSVSATTRAPRPGEIDGVHYRFIDPARFRALVDDGAFLEHATVYDRCYGTLAAPTFDAMGQGRSLILDIDAQGAAQVRERLPEAVHVMLLPPALEALEARLRTRGTDDDLRLRARQRRLRRGRGCAPGHPAGRAVAHRPPRERHRGPAGRAPTDSRAALTLS
jgi:guanylate kinase